MKEKPTPLKVKKKVDKNFIIEYRWYNGTTSFSHNFPKFTWTPWKKYESYVKVEDRDKAYTTMVSKQARQSYGLKMEYRKVDL